MNGGGELLAFAGELADAARAVTLPAFRQPLTVENKSDASPVTATDRACEAALRRLIAARYPAHGVVGEEMDNTNADADYVWVLDPIDGTRSFISGSPLFCTLIALTHRGRAVVGLIDVPALDERWTGVCDDDTQQAWHRQKPCRVRSGVKALSQAVMVTTTPGYPGGEALTRLSQASGYAQLGGDAFAYGCLAGGFADVVADTAMQPHDYLPLVPIVQAAGGIISDWHGDGLTLAGGVRGVVAAADKHLHQQALAVLADD